MRNLLLSVFSHRTLATARWDLGLLGVRALAALSGQRGRIRRVVAARGAPLYLNLGAGPSGRRDGRWINVDGAPADGVDFLIDFQRPLPFDDATFDGVFCEHVLEHFSQADGEALAREVARVLRPGGVLRAIVPDGAFVLRTYLDDPEALIAARGGVDATAMETVNAYFRQRYEHQFIYDWETLAATLRRAGFAAVSRSDFERGCAELAIDDPKYAPESLYVEARTPPGSEGA